MGHDARSGLIIVKKEMLTGTITKKNQYVQALHTWNIQTGRKDKERQRLTVILLAYRINGIYTHSARKLASLESTINDMAGSVKNIV